MELQGKGREVPESISKKYICDVNTNVWKRPEYKGMAYSDGNEIEERLTRIVKGVGDVSLMSVELARHCTDWPTNYHFSNMRANLLRPFEEQLQGMRILEIGAGCGAITRYLGEVGGKVLAVEGSLRRAAIAAKRCQDLGNVTVVAEAAHELPIGQKFDVVTLIGVLEYARKFFPGNGKDPVDEMLKYIAGFLKPGGKVFLAIENQLGLKYFAGFPEDHLGQAMVGVEDRYGNSGPVTFGRKELERRLRGAGLSVYQWWYPFPDYKLTKCMVSEQGTYYSEDMDLSPILRQACSDDYQYPSMLTFSPEKALLPIVRNGMLKDMANSFLLVASNVDVKNGTDLPLAIHYASTRLPEFTKKVIFTRSKDGVPMTYQVPLYPQAIPQPDSKLHFRLEHQAFVTGQLWQDKLLDIMTTSEWTLQHLQAWLQVWLKAFLQVAGLMYKTDLKEHKISGKFIDLIAGNLIIGKNGEENFIDREWELCENVEVGYVVFRTLFTAFGILPPVANPLDQSNLSIIPLIMKLGEGVGMTYSIQDIHHYLDLERSFRRMAVGSELAGNAVIISKMFCQKRTQFDAYKRTKAREHQLVELLEVVKGREQEITELKRELREGKAEHARFTMPQQTTYSNLGVIECSIIIPVFNRVELTQECLMHLAKVTTGISYEVVLVDNHSTDGTSEFLETLGGDVQIIRNATNLGFAKACNQGACAAKGKYLVFLNNDTIPKPGWLGPLLQEVDSHDDVAVVGSKLLYQNNTIQHVGVVFSKLLQEPYHFLSGVEESMPAVNIRRELQAVTAACMLVRKEIFEDVGGFDEGFVNGFEDMDLCLKIRAMGKKVIYQPKSCVYHLEGQTAGRKTHNEANAKRFKERWDHQWLVDDDLVAYQSGYILQQSVVDTKLQCRLIPIHQVAKSAAWQRVVELQQLLVGRKCQPLSHMDDSHKIRDLLVDVEAWPNDLVILEWLGSVCVTLECEQEAAKFWEKLFTIRDSSNARLGLARLSLRNGNFDEAQKHLDVLKRDFNPSEEGLRLQGILSMQRQNYSEAKLAFRQSLAIDGENSKARMGLGMACMGLNQSDEAWDIIEQVVSVDPDNIEAMHCLIQAGTALQRWESLGNHLAQFVERNPVDCDMRFALAGVQFRTGYFEKAKEHLTWLRLMKPELEGLEDLEGLLSATPPQEAIASIH